MAAVPKTEMTMSIDRPSLRVLERLARAIEEQNKHMAKANQLAAREQNVSAALAEHARAAEEAADGPVPR